MISPYDTWIDSCNRIGSIFADGGIGVTSLNDYLGGVQLIFGLCYVCDDRGWISDNDNGANRSYYLYSGAWYLTSSPHTMGIDEHARIVNVNSNGYVGFRLADDIGGVQF